MKTNKGPAPGFIDNTDHVVEITGSDQCWTVRLGDLVLADSTRAQVLKETGFESVIYFPSEDVSMSHLIHTDDRTTCPFKSEARYFVNAAAEGGRPIAWTYPSVFDEAAPIKGHVAFFDDRVELRRELIGATNGNLADAQPSHLRRVRLVRGLRQLDADIVLLDLGAGAHASVLDYFLVSDDGILVLQPEPTSIENAYSFLRAAFYRRLRLAMTESVSLAPRP